MTTPRYLNANQSLQVAAQQIAAGKIDYAKGVVKQVLSSDPGNVDALHLMSMIHYQEGSLAAAINCSKQAVDIMPDSVALLNNLGTLLKVAGDMKAAQFYYAKAIEVDPKCFPAFFNLAAAFAASGDLETAVKHYRKAATIQPDYADVHYNLGLSLRGLKRYDEAVDSLEKALKLEPKHFQARCEIGTCYSDQGKFNEAVEHYKMAEAIEPSSAELQNNLGVALTSAGELLEAKKHLEKAVRLKPNFGEARNNLAVLQTQSGEHDQAVETLAKLVRQNPDDINVLRNYGQALNLIGRFEESVEVLDKVVTLAPDLYEGWLDLAVALTQIQCDAEAHEAFARAQELRPAAITPRWGLAMTQLKCFYEEEEEISNSFDLYENSINSLVDHIRSDLEKYAAETADAMRFLTPFYLILHDRNFKDIQRTLGSLACDVMAHLHPECSGSANSVCCDSASHAHKTDCSDFARAKPITSRRVRVGIVSHQIHDHTLYKCIIRGWAKQLDRSRFEVTAYSTNTYRDKSTEEARELFEHYVELPEFEAMRDRILADGQDLLIYPGLGLESHTYRLASLKLAPVQCASYGHPITMGLPTIDHYFVSELMEPEDAHEHYSESITRLPGLGAFYEPSGVKPREVDLQKLGVKPDSTLFLCLQHLHKYLPQYDELLPRIAKRVPNAQFIFGRKNSRLAPLLMNRLVLAFEKHGLNAQEYVVFLPELSHDQYFGLCESGHVFLDTPLNSGLMTTLEALEAGIVPVTLPGKFMRSMQTARVLEGIGVTSTIVDSMDGYVDVAVKLAEDKDYREDLRKQIKENVHRVYRQKEAVEALEKSLLQMMAK